ncbi:signal transduction histidine kinase [Anaerotaenia torta]|uniref:hybrid sensor histidine kinase/response regulator n=1 Tax=Anaerotaenia torta TaxID=433293 RepID=UPI003D1E88F0
MKVLVVDDSQLNLTIAKSYLDAIPDITQIFLCNDPIQVELLLAQESIDIIILDILMPAVTGIDLLARLKSDPEYDDVPVIMLTSLDDLESYTRCFDLGAFDYINKPINHIEFNARLKVAIEAKNSSNRLKALIEMTQKQNEELKIMNAQLTEAKFSLVQSEKMAAIGQLAAGIAHEINNPMGFVSSNFDILRRYFSRIKEFLDLVQAGMNEEEPSGDLQQSVFHRYKTQVTDKYRTLKMDIILNNLEDIFSDTDSGIKRITDIITSLRVSARTSGDSVKSTHVLLDMLSQIILTTRDEVSPVADVRLEVPDDIIIYCNRVQLGQVFINIILNAAEAIRSQERPGRGLIQILARKADQQVFIQILDDGPGIPEASLPRIFEPFFTTKVTGEGTGLGLSISYDIIVNKHKGSIDVKSELGKGAAFLITLPILPAM